MDKKIIHIISHLKIGGAQRLVLDIAKNMPNVKVLALKENINLSNKLFPLVIRRIYRYLKQEKPALVHTHLWHADVFGGLASIIAKIPFISTEHSINLEEEGFLKHLSKKYIFKKAHFVIAISRAVAKYLENSLGVPKEKIKLIYNGVDEKKFTYRNHPANKTPIIICLGRLEKRKGQDTLIETLKDLADLSFVCGLVGDGSQKKYLINLVKKYHLENRIKFLGEQENVVKFIAQADFLVMPSRQEGLGLAAIEGALIGRPTIAFNVGGLSDVIINGQTGFLIEAGDLGEFKNKIKLLLAERKLTKEMGEKAHQLAREKFTLTKMIEEYQKIYAHIANQ